MPIPKEAYAHEPDLQLVWQRDRQLSIVRERCRQLGQELFEVCCQLPKTGDAKDFAEALALVAELKALRTCEERLTQSGEGEAGGLVGFVMHPK